MLNGIQKSKKSGSGIIHKKKKKAYHNKKKGKDYYNLEWISPEDP